MKKLLLPIITLSLILFSSVLIAQKGPYSIAASVEFESPRGHKVSEPIAYGSLGIIQFNKKGLESYSLQLFSNDLKLKKEKIVGIEERFGDRVTDDGIGVVKFKNRSYLFVREVIKNDKGKAEGMSALEFFPDKLDFANKSKNLFLAGNKVAFGMSGFYGFDVSNDETKFMCNYSLAPEERNDKLNKEIVGLQVFDEDLNKIWAEEVKMPYSEAVMDNLSYTLSDDGKVYILAKVYENDDRKEVGKDKKAPSYHFEVLVYQKGSKTPKIIEIKIDTNFPTEAFIYEDNDHTIIVAGFYTKNVKSYAIEGAYLVRLDLEKGKTIKLNDGYYEIPTDIIKSYTSDREKRKIEKKEEKDEDNDIGVRYLQIRKIYYGLEGGSTKILAEQYHVVSHTHYNGKTTSTTYSTHAEDIFVFSIDKNGKLEFVSKIPKAQHSGDALGAGLSFNSMVTGNTLHIFFIDNLKNFNLAPTAAPYRHLNGKGGFLTAVNIDGKGVVKKFNLGEIERYETNFFIRGFVKGDNNNLISTERKKKINILFSITVK